MRTWFRGIQQASKVRVHLYLVYDNAGATKAAETNEVDGWVGIFSELSTLSLEIG